MGFDLGDYNDVAARIREFRDKYPDGSLRPADPAKPFGIETIGDRVFIVYVAAAYRNPEDPCPGIGVAWEPFPGKTSYTRDSELMNAETSAWGRAIVAALASDTKHVASRDEPQARADHPAGKTRPAQAKVTQLREKAQATAVVPDHVAPVLERLNALPETSRKTVKADVAQRYGKPHTWTEEQAAEIGQIIDESPF